MTWMSEAGELCQSAIRDAVGQSSRGERPHRAGDYSFNNIGLTSFYMLSSTIPAEERMEKGYYEVGGCGANIEWHSEEDLMHVADMEILLQDIKVYMTTILRVVDSPIHPFCFTKTVEEWIDTLDEYQSLVADRFSFGLVRKEAEELHLELLSFYQQLEALPTPAILDPAVRVANEIIRRLGRELVPINFSRTGKFRHDLAIDMPRLPDLAAAQLLSTLTPGTHAYQATLTHLTRGQNRVAWALQRARKLVKTRLLQQTQKSSSQRGEVAP